MKTRAGLLCPCGSGKPYVACCKLLHQGQQASDAEALMRSRYSAYALGLEAYLLQTWHARTRPAELELENRQAPAKWIGLEVRRHAVTGNDSATVEFVARCRIGGRAHRQHEISRFVCEDGRWYYVDDQME